MFLQITFGSLQGQYSTQISFIVNLQVFFSVDPKATNFSKSVLVYAFWVKLLTLYSLYRELIPQFLFNVRYFLCNKKYMLKFILQLLITWMAENLGSEPFDCQFQPLKFFCFEINIVKDKYKRIPVIKRNYCLARSCTKRFQERNKHYFEFSLLSSVQKLSLVRFN